MTTNYITLNDNVIEMLQCPFCGSSLDFKKDGPVECHSCASSFPYREVNTGENVEEVLDLKIYYPEQFSPQGYVKWAELQKEFEDFHEHYSDLENGKVYLEEIDSVKEIYQDEFKLSGKILDVGGNQGRLRQFLDLDSPDVEYVSIDPSYNVFYNLQKQPTLTKTFDCLNRPCNFVSASAENLPFKNETFDWVHMRSVIDHFENPFYALKEAYRVLKPGGRILVGLAIEDKGMDESIATRLAKKAKNEGVGSIAQAVSRRAKGLLKGHVDDHMFRFTDTDLAKLIEQCGFKVEKSHWQKPPYSFVIYLSAIKS